MPLGVRGDEIDEVRVRGFSALGDPDQVTRVDMYCLKVSVQSPSAVRVEANVADPEIRGAEYMSILRVNGLSATI